MADAPTSTTSPGTFRRKTRRRVRVVDRAARTAISIGGVAIILAVFAIMAYLVICTAPLFRSGQTHPLGPARTVALTAAAQAMVLDEYAGSVLIVHSDASASLVSIPDSVVIDRISFGASGRTVTAISHPTETGAMAVGYEDGAVQVGTIGFVTDYPTAEQVGIDPATMAVGERRVVTAREGEPAGYVELTSLRQLRWTRPKIEFAAPTNLSGGSGAVRRIDFRSTAAAQMLVAIRQDGSAVYNTVQITRPLGGGKPRTRLSSAPFNYSAPKGQNALPDWLYLTADGGSVLAVWADGTARRFSRDPKGEGFVVAETTDVLGGSGGKVTAAEMLLGGKTLVVGDDRGNLAGAFVARMGDPTTPDNARLVRGHEFAADSAGNAAVTALGTSLRDRTFLVADASGRMRLINMTSEKEVARQASGMSAPVKLAAMNIKKDGTIVALSGENELAVWSLNPFHPEASAKALFGKVWYEGDAGPSYTYQSSSGEDTAEMKYSIVPLVFGTIKATVYAMLFAVPIALLAALYTSEMLHPSVRNRVKPAIEMMASLPSVVLGFVAAMIIAPWARDWLPSILLAFVAVPFGAVLAARLWQALPIRLTARTTSLQHLGLVGLVLGAALGASALFGSVAERLLFAPSNDDVLLLAGSFEPVPRSQWPAAIADKATLTSDEARPLRRQGLYYRAGQLVRPVGSVTDAKVRSAIEADRLDRADIRLWLDGVTGSPWPGWFVLMVPAGFILTALFRGRLVDLLMAAVPHRRGQQSAALVELARFGLTTVVALGLATTLSTLLTSMGLDARDSVFGSYNQRNTLVVGIVMGFAIIPIIYTISEDALSAVPGQLRSASLGCGATRWQTAVRVVLPLALSGILSACMIGLGRAAGETMIVLMATGNTPSMDWNIFSGFRTLSANIAVEMPEAAENTTHYRVLFLGGLSLFAMTFVVNTAAEFLRQRVRRRGAAL